MASMVDPQTNNSYSMNSTHNNYSIDSSNNSYSIHGSRIWQVCI